jgi:DNA-binding CsgD family transcriptional regulator
LKPGLEELRARVSGAIPSTWRPGTKLDVEWLPKSEFVRTQYYNEFYKTLDIHSDLSLGFAADKGNWTGVDVYRPERHGLFSKDDVATCYTYLPHFIRSLKLSRKLAAQRGVEAGLAEVFDRSPHGLYLLDRSGRVCLANTAGRGFLAEPNALSLSDGRLSATSRDAARRLQGLIARAAATDRETRTGGSMALATPDRLLPLSIIVAPLRADHVASLHSGPAVLVCVIDLEGGITLPEERLRDLFGLSIAESRVAIALFEGREPKLVAEHLGLEVTTVRTHLARLFAKTSTRSQVELARLLMRTIGAGLN